MSWRHRALDRRKLSRWRLAVLERDGWACRRCRRYANEADHIEPLERGGGAYDLANGQALCRHCHQEKTAVENGRHKVEGRAEWLDFLAEFTS